MAAVEENPKELIAELARLFYAKVRVQIKWNITTLFCCLQGWFPGSGGSLTMRTGEDKIYIAPSGVQKERIKPEDIFIINRHAEVVERPLNRPELKPSQCTPLFMTAYNGKILDKLYY